MSKKIILWVLTIAILGAVAAWLIYRFTVEKRLDFVSPRENAILQAGQTHPITWNSRNISKVGIILIKGTSGQDTKWIAQNVSGRKRSYDWNIFAWEEPRQDYRVAVFEYPWKEGNKITYSDFFTILGPEFASCDSLSVEAEWPFVPSDFPDLRKVFITSKNYTGDLGRLEGADAKCQQEAVEKGFAGDWKAFLGDDTKFVAERLNLEGIFVMAESSGDLPEGKACHRLLGRDFNEFLSKLSEPLLLNQEKIDAAFLKDLQKVWLGKINAESQRECTVISEFFGGAPSALPFNYSFTTTCQNWTSGSQVVPGYPPEVGKEIEFPACFTPTGAKTNAIGVAGLSSGAVKIKGQDFLTVSLGKSCAISQKLLCVQQ